MRYVLYLFTLALAFTSGMLVGNFYLPARNASVAAAVSVPDLDRVNPALDEATAQRARQDLQTITQALTACPVVVDTEKERLFNQLSLFMALQDFEIKKAVYEAEIAKNTKETRPTGQFSRAAAEYFAAKTQTEQLADSLFPPASLPETPAEPPAETAVSSSTATSASSQDNKKDSAAPAAKTPSK